MAPRALITGLGVVSPLGKGLERYWSALLHEEPRPLPDPAIVPRSMAIRHDYTVANRLEYAVAMEPYQGIASGFAVEAARMALADAGLSVEAAKAAGAGVSIGNAMGDDVYERARNGGRPPTSLEAFPFDLGASVATALALTGPNLSVSTACSAGLYSVALAAELIENDAAEVMVVGGAEAICRVAMGCFNRLGAFDPEVCRPFDSRRAGTIAGEGAAMLVLESKAHAERRGRARAYAEVKGSGWSCDGYHATIPEPSGSHAVAAALRAFADAGIGPEQVSCVMAHGTGTSQNDLMESVMIESVFGSEARRPFVTAIKSKLGHGGGAAGAFQCLTSALVLHHQTVPPTGHVAQLDPRCSVRLVVGSPVTFAAEHVLINSYAFGGNNISLLLGRVGA